MQQLNLPVYEYARDMGEALAILHWAAHINAYDVEFVIGSEPWYVDDKDGGDTAGAAERRGSPGAPDLGPEADFSKRLTRMWVLDFNLYSRLPMDRLEEPGVADAILGMLVLGVFENDPYYPLPLAEAPGDRKMREEFRATYISMAKKILDKDNNRWAVWANGENSPERFVTVCIEREKKNLDEGKGHGHREESNTCSRAQSPRSRPRHMKLRWPGRWKGPDGLGQAALENQKKKKKLQEVVLVTTKCSSLLLFSPQYLYVFSACIPL
ncbi:hypothetical protein N3K66_004249 [Trichothecium roseum]|uniref:Uncharacterized protein n=1 Tax=Trichothecium roseum TaxID=47278 RepID=A0ACC0V127_9HYPO|nr:hypothetical protein N3K66_004249 [Trichothecium roseum]